jgi:bacterial/archaeal transporter family protein
MSSAVNVDAPVTPGKRFPAWLVYSLLTIALWGVWAAVSKVISSEIDATTNQVLFAIGLVPVMLVVYRSPRVKGGANRRRGIFYAFITGVLGGTGNIAFFRSLMVGGKASIVVPATSLSPVVTVLMGYFVLRERLTASQKVGLVVAMAAIYLLSL